MVGIKKEIWNEKKFEFPEGTREITNVKSILDKKKSVDNKYSLSKGEIRILEYWNYFIRISVL